MRTEQSFFIRTGPVTCLLLLASCVAALAQNDKNGKYACSEPNPQSVCNAGNTCGSSSSPCIVDVKRSDYGASATPSIADAKADSTFCVKSGTTIVWKSTQKNTGFVVDFGSPAAFGSDDAIMGGATRPISVTAQKARLLQVFRGRMHLRRDTGNVRLHYG
jgi:hypothetical protein